MSCSWPLAPSQLNEVYKFGQFTIPAGSLVSSLNDPIVFENYQSTGSGEAPVERVAKFAAGVDSEAYFKWFFKSDFVKVPAAQIKLKVNPIWFAKTTAADPNNQVAWEVGAANLNLGSSINQNAPTETDQYQIVPATAFLLQGGIVGNPEAVPDLAVSGDTLSGSNMNILTISIERDGVKAEDTFADDVFIGFRHTICSGF